MEKSKIIKENNKVSNWIKLEKTGPYTESASHLENENTIEVINYILSQFQETPKSLKPVFKERLIIWLENLNESDYKIEENDKIRDFIYEMF
jgi:hypothetical protein